MTVIGKRLAMTVGDQRLAMTVGGQRLAMTQIFHKTEIKQLIS